MMISIINILSAEKNTAKIILMKN